VGLVKGEDDEAVLGQFIGVDGRPLFLAPSIRRADAQCGQRLLLVDVLRVVEVTGEGELVAIVKLDVVALNAIV
jgi:hypothetical protein